MDCFLNLRRLVMPIALVVVLLVNITEAQRQRTVIRSRQTGPVPHGVHVPNPNFSGVRVQGCPDCAPVVVHTNATTTNLGPSAKAAVRVRVQGSCGSGSVCGPDLVLTNAHVVGTTVGKEVVVDAVVEGQRVTVPGRVVIAAYSSKSQTDWAIVKTKGLAGKIKPVRLSMKKPSGRHYTKGSPRCVWPLTSTWIDTVSISDNMPLMRWNPPSISGQSGSGVWSRSTGRQEALLTWLWGGYGAGQQTAEIYRQAKNQTTDGFPRPMATKLIEVIDGDRAETEDGYFASVSVETLDIWDHGEELSERGGGDDKPLIESGFFQEAGIVDLDIWGEGKKPKPEPTPETPDDSPKDDGSEGDGDQTRRGVLVLVAAVGLAVISYLTGYHRRPAVDAARERKAREMEAASIAKERRETERLSQMIQATIDAKLKGVDTNARS